METDVALLEQYARSRNADAFAELVRRYAGMVYGTCLRVTGNPHDAEDVAQECFMTLARRAGSLGASLPGWLHCLAVSRAIDARRTAARRRRHEVEASRAQATQADQEGPAWAEVAPHVDEALAELPDELRLPVIEHYLRGRGQGDIAAELGVGQPTVSRRIEKGLELLRSRLTKTGVVAPAAILGALLADNAAQAAPARLTMTLGKMAIAGPSAMGGAGMIKTAAVVVLGTTLISVGVMTAAMSGGEKPPTAVAAPVVTTAPPTDTGGEKFILRETYAAGNYVRTQQTDGEQRMSMSGTDLPVQQLSLTVVTIERREPVGAQGEQKIGMTFKSFQVDIQGGGIAVSYHSDKPTNERTPAAAAVYAPLIGAEIVLVRNAKDEIVVVKGLDEVWDQALKKDPNNVMAKVMKEKMGTDFIKQTVGARSKALPDKPVGVGDEWQAEWEMQVPFFGPLTFSQQCGLLRVEKAQTGPIAVVQYVGHIADNEGRTIQLGPASAAIKKVEFERTGHFRFDIQAGTVVAMEEEVRGSVAMSVNEPGGKSTDVTVTQDMKSKTTVRAATEEDLKPIAPPEGKAAPAAAEGE